MTRRGSPGFTLPELLVTLTLLAIAFAYAAPRLDSLLAEHRSQAIMSELAARIESARKHALARAQTVRLCPGTSACGEPGNWIEETALVTEEGDLLRRFPPLAASGEINWRSFGNRAWIQFAPNGLTPNQSGRLTYCPENGDARRARQLIVNASGRVRFATDADGDGIIESSDGTPVVC